MDKGAGPNRGSRLTSGRETCVDDVATLVQKGHGGNRDNNIDDKKKRRYPRPAISEESGLSNAMVEARAMQRRPKLGDYRKAVKVQRY